MAVENDDAQESGTRINRLELVAAIVLGFAAVLTAFAAYRGALTDDLVLKNYAESQSNITQGNDWYAAGYQATALEQSTFFQYAVESLGGNEEGSQFLYGLMTAVAAVADRRMGCRRA